jgi:hypothetical protein
MSNAIDKLSRDDIKNTDLFGQLASEIQVILNRAAMRGAANGPDDLRTIVGCDWIMVPTKMGQRQVVVTAGRAYLI